MKEGMKMADTAVKTAARAAGKTKANRLTIVFDGRFADLFGRIKIKSIADDRDPDTTVLRILEESFRTVAEPQQ